MLSPNMSRALGRVVREAGIASDKGRNLVWVELAAFIVKIASERGEDDEDPRIREEIANHPEIAALIRLVADPQALEILGLDEGQAP